MKIFKADRLLKLTKIMYESQQRLNTKNWEDTLKVHHREIERLLEKLGVFDKWRSKLEQYGNVAKNLVTEMFMDAYMSVHFGTCQQV